MSLAALSLVAFMASFGHCYAMCGGFVLAFNRLCIKDNKNIYFYHLSYHLARILAYVLLGLFFGLFGAFFKFSSYASNILLFILGILLVILALALFFRGRLLFFIENSFFLKNFKHFFSKAFAFRGFKASFILGFCNGLLPCGLVYSFLAMALSTQSLARAAFTMLFFGLATLPAMFLFSYFSSLLKSKYLKIFNFFSYFLIMLYGLHLSFSAFLATKL